MNIPKEQKIDMYLKKIAWYGCYVDCFSRIINEFIQNDDGNINPQDIPNLTEILTKMSHRLYKNIISMKSDWEFME